MIKQIFVISLLLFYTSIALGQESASPVLRVEGEVGRQLKLTASDLAKLPKISLTAKGHDGRESAFDGVALVEILKLAGVEFGEKLRGKSMALFLVVEAVDGSKAIFSLAELDPDYNDRQIILAYTRAGKPLAKEEGPWRVVVPGEKRQARWVRQVTALVVRRA